MAARKRVTKPCARCGRMMKNVDYRRYYCNDCKPLVAAEGKRRRRKQAAPTATKHKTLDECVREADALGISYGEYIGKRLDKT